jgi:hypothetical protein
MRSSEYLSSSSGPAWAVDDEGEFPGEIEGRLGWRIGAYSSWALPTRPGEQDQLAWALVVEDDAGDEPPSQSH